MEVRASTPGAHAGGHDHGAMLADYWRRFVVSLVLTIPILALTPEVQALAGVEFTFPGQAYRGLPPRVPGLLLRRVAVPRGVREGDPDAPHRDDDPHRPRHHGRLRLLRGGGARVRAGHGLLLGARDPDRHHAPRPLHRDALGDGGLPGARGARPDHAVRGPPRPRRRDRRRAGQRPGGRRRRPGPARREGPGRRRGDRRAGRA